MDTLLAIEVSPRFEGSISRTLTAKFVEQWEAAVCTENLTRAYW